MKTKLEIVRVDVINKYDAQPPSKLTVSYQGWWHLTKLHVPLALEVLKDGSQPAKKPGQINLVQRFPNGKAPTFRVKGRNSLLEFRLYARRSLRTRAEVSVGDLVSCTSQGVAKVPFPEKVDGKVAKAFLSVAQMAPFATPIHDTDTAFDPATNPSTHSGHRQENQETGEGMHQSQPVSPVDYDADFVRLWKKVFPADCDADFVRLWKDVFVDQNDT